jgi:hypothetical protein
MVKKEAFEDLQGGGDENIKTGKKKKEGKERKKSLAVRAQRVYRRLLPMAARYPYYVETSVCFPTVGRT